MARLAHRLRVLHVITHLGVGGAQDNTLVTVEGLDRSRYEVHLAAGLDESNWLGRARRCADRTFTLNAMHRPIRPASDARAFWQLMELLRANGYDVVHTHSTKAGILGRLAGSCADVPVVVHTIHGFAWHAGTSRARRTFYVQLERLAGRLCDHLIAVSESNREDAVKLGIAHAEKISIIHSGVEFGTFDITVDRAQKFRQLGLDPDRPIVGTVGRLSPQKAPLDFLRVARSVLARRPEVQFVMVGDGPLRDEVASEASDLPEVRLLGLRDDVPEILRVFDVFAMTSLWEGLSRALTEAMICRLPVAVTAVDGVPEIVLHGETGLLSPPGEPEKLAENVLWLLDHRDEALRMGGNARKQVVPAFSAERMVKEIESLYLELARRKGLAPEDDTLV